MEEWSLRGLVFRLEFLVIGRCLGFGGGVELVFLVLYMVFFLYSFYLFFL